MARKPRLHVPGGLFHVILRGNAGQDIFFRAEDRSRKSEYFALNHGWDRAMSRHFQEFSPRGGCYPALAHHFRH